MVTCAKGHINDPYPEDGLCTTCHIFLPDNQASAIAAGARREFTRAQKDVAKGLLEDEGISWQSATEVLKQLALSYAKTQHNKTLELMLQQIGTLRARPKPGEEQTVTEYQVTLSADTVDSLARSLAVVQGLLE